MSAAAGPAKEYTLDFVRPRANKDGEGKWYQSDDNPYKESYGAFRVSKNFRVVKTSRPTEKNVNGIVIQMVTKVPDVYWIRHKPTGKDAEVKAVEDPDDPNSIETVTLNRVKYMWLPYFEFFVIKDSYSIDVDSFQNAALCSWKRESTGYNPWAEDTDPPGAGAPSPYTYSKGTITVVGKSIFIPCDIPSTDTHEELEQVNKNMLSKLPAPLDSLRSLGKKWSAAKTTPANGLGFLPYSEEAEEVIFGLSQSNELNHSVTVTWDLPDAAKTRQHSKVTSVPPIPSYRRGGSRAGTNKRKTYRKRRQ